MKRKKKQIVQIGNSIQTALKHIVQCHEKIEISHMMPKSAVEHSFKVNLVFS